MNNQFAHGRRPVAVGRSSGTGCWRVRLAERSHCIAYSAQGRWPHVQLPRDRGDELA